MTQKIAPAALSARALEDLRSAARWIAKNNPSAARGLRVSVRSAALMLAEHPLSGFTREDIAPSRFRFLVLASYPYVLMYDATLNPPYITRILHGARDLPTLLQDL
ncbi:MAG: type II toxin-antitoxin system RelE/ParE family toxin [Rhodospirillaceae bacterium]|nr:type II toxin-antitoxin system RelE/ParE family toxin [Rhodospirillaceae bacterium]